MFFFSSASIGSTIINKKYLSDYRISVSEVTIRYIIYVLSLQLYTGRVQRVGSAIVGLWSLHDPVVDSKTGCQDFMTVFPECSHERYFHPSR